MRDYSKVSPSFWTGETGREIIASGQEAVIVSLYLLTSPHANMLGLYYLPLAYISHDTGLPFGGASKGLAMAIACGFCGYDETKQVVWVYEMAKYQIAPSLKESDKRVLGIRQEVQRLPKCKFLNDFFNEYRDLFHLGESSPSEAPSKPLRSQEQEQEQEQEEKDIVEQSPTPDEPNGDSKPKEKTTIPYSEIIDNLNSECKTQFRASTKATRNLIKARWNEGWRAEDFAEVIAAKWAEWGPDPKMFMFLRPETLFGTKFESYLQAARSAGGLVRAACGAERCPSCIHKDAEVCQDKPDEKRINCTYFQEFEAA